MSAEHFFIARCSSTPTRLGPGPQQLIRHVKELVRLIVVVVVVVVVGDCELRRALKW